MKKTLLSAIVIYSLFSNAQTQLPNAGFETWEVVNFENTTYEAPTPWDAGQFCVSTGNTAECSISATKSSAANSGQFSAKVINDGFLGLTLLDYSFTDAPTAVEFYGKTTLAENAEAEFSIYLHEGSILDDPETVAVEESFLITNTTSGFQKYVVPLNYDPNETYDKISFIIKMESDNSTFWVDDIKLIYDPLAISSSIKTNNKITMSPNPANDEVFFSDEMELIEVRAMNGDLIKATFNAKSINLTEINPGIYFIRLQNENGTYIQTEKLVIN